MMERHVIERARVTSITDELARRGINNLRRSGSELIGPCPICAGRDRFAVNTQKRVCNCRQCGLKGNVIALVMAVDGVGFNAAVELLTGEKCGVIERTAAPFNAKADEPRLRKDDDLDRIRRARDIWHAARDPRGTLGEIYLCLRQLALDDASAGRVLRFNPRTPWRNENTMAIEYLPALIAAFRSLDDDEITGIHRIALKPDGHKLGRRMLGIVHRAAVKLDEDIGDELAIGEGVETCLAARLLGIRPAWALGSVGAIARFPVLPGIRLLRIIGENDQASADAIEQCGLRWMAAGRRVRIIKPAPDCKDLNDCIGRA